MENKNYINIQSFWMFVAGLVVGLLVLLVVTQLQNLQDGQTRVLRYTSPSIDTVQLDTRSVYDASTADLNTSTYNTLDSSSLTNLERTGSINPSH